MAEMTRPRVQTGPSVQAAGYGHQRRTPSIASEISLAAVVTVIGYARAYVTSIVTAWGLECLRDDAVLLTSELVTNAVRATCITGPAPRWSDPHHLALIRLRLIVVDDSLIIEVWDREATPPVLPDTPDPEDESGRGLLIVAGLSKQWNYYRLAEGGKWVWAELGIPANPGPLPHRQPTYLPPPARPHQITHDPTLLRRVHDELKRL
ncbi:MAG: ATP-binding protein [Streptosporangiaceae bacterium]